MRNRLSTFERREEEVRKGGGLAFSFFGVCVSMLYGGRWGRIGRGRRDEAKRREREKGGSKKKSSLLF